MTAARLAAVFSPLRGGTKFQIEPQVWVLRSFAGAAFTQFAWTLGPGSAGAFLLSGLMPVLWRGWAVMNIPPERGRPVDIHWEGDVKLNGRNGATIDSHEPHR
jgi:hypothetical protein